MIYIRPEHHGWKQILDTISLSHVIKSSEIEAMIRNRSSKTVYLMIATEQNEYNRMLAWTEYSKNSPDRVEWAKHRNITVEYIASYTKQIL